VVFAQRPAAVGEDPQHRQLLVTGHPAQGRPSGWRPARPSARR
jgi:hypothetical protein